MANAFYRVPLLTLLVFPGSFANETLVQPLRIGEMYVVGQMGRRAFLGAGAAGLVGAGAAGSTWAATGAADDGAKTRLAMVRHDRATDEEGTGNPRVVREMVHRAVRELAGKEPLAEAWRVFVSPDDVVGVKLNVRAGRRLSVQVCTTDAIIEGLKAAGVPDRNILIWDAWSKELPRAGYALNESGEGIRCYGSDHGVLKHRLRADKEEARVALRPYFADEPVVLGGKPVWVTKILAEEVTALINVPIIKEHYYAGVTLGMKNHYGSILNPSDLHDNNCDPFLAELNALPVIKDKTRFVLLDALRGIYAGGPYLKPQYRFRPNTIIAGTDPVAVDALGLRIIEEKRKAEGEPPIGERAKHIATAAQMGLGTDDFSRIELREVDLTLGEER